jgi:tetratricopeptide (TPR) repeat protein
VTINLKILLLKANLCIRLFLFACFLFLNQQILAQQNIQLQNAYNQFYDFELDSCENSLEKATPDPSSFYLKSLVSFARIYINDDPAYYKKNKSTESHLLDNLDKYKLTEEYNDFLKSEIKLQWAILKLKNGDEFSAFWNLKQAYNIAIENTENYPDFIPSHKTLGLLHVLFGVFPDKYDWLLSLFGIEGDVEKGLTELDKANNSSHHLALESNITTALLYTYLLNDPEKGSYIMRNIHEQNKYLLVDYAFVLILIKNAQSELASKIIEHTFESHEEPLKIPQLYYAYGEIFLQKGELDLAIKYYQQFLSLNKSKNLVKDANYKVGVCFFLKDMPDSVNKYFDASKNYEWAKNETDKNAQLALNSKIKPNKNLLQLRYATDGGYYENAFKIHELIDTTTLNLHDKCEFAYRSARLYDKSGEIEKAIRNYQKTIIAQESQNWYYAPNSALQLGLIYYQRGDEENSRKYLEINSNYNGYPYQNSIRRKAKSALKELD